MLKNTLLSLSFLAVCVQSVFAAFTITLDSITTNSMVVSFSGTLPALPDGDVTGGQAFYIGVPGVTGWLTSDASEVSIISNGTNTQLPVGGAAQSFPSGDVAVVVFGSQVAEGDEYNFTATFNDGTYIPANLNGSAMIVALGYEDADLLPDPATQIGSTVPEPSTYAMMAGFGVLGLAFLCRRKR